MTRNDRSGNRDAGKVDANAGNDGSVTLKKGKYSELPLRIVSAVALAAFVLYCTWTGGQTFLLLLVAGSLIVLWEFRKIVSGSLPAMMGIAAFGFLLLLHVSHGLGEPQTGLAIAAIGAIALAVWEIIVRRSIWGMTGLVYAALPFVSMAALREGSSGLFTILFVFACVWGSDVFAYFTGKTLGGPKLAPRISPNKTWSGFLGGFAGAVVASALLAIAFDIAVSIRLAMLALLLAFFSQIGDLFESWIKRRFGIKDSGMIIPGHGGLLDRIDGLIFASAAAFLAGAFLSPHGIHGGDVADALSRSFFRSSL